MPAVYQPSTRGASPTCAASWVSHDPAAPSVFLRDAFTDAELNLLKSA